MEELFGGFKPAFAQKLPNFVGKHTRVSAHGSQWKLWSQYVEVRSLVFAATTFLVVLLSFLLQITSFRYALLHYATIYLLTRFLATAGANGPLWYPADNYLEACNDAQGSSKTKAKHPRTLVMTGGSHGIGLEAAWRLHAHGVERIVIGVRRANQRKEELKKQLLTLSKQSGSTQCNMGYRMCKKCDSNVEFIELDLEDFSSVRNFAATLLQKNSSIDMLIFNAGVYYYNFNDFGVKDLVADNSDNDAQGNGVKGDDAQGERIKDGSFREGAQQPGSGQEKTEQTKNSEEQTLSFDSIWMRMLRKAVKANHFYQNENYLKLMKINVYSHALLFELLKNHLSPGCRVISTSSLAHMFPSDKNEILSYIDRSLEAEPAAEAQDTKPAVEPAMEPAKEPATKSNVNSNVKAAFGTLSKVHEMNAIYGISKLLNIFCSKYWAAENPQIVSVSLHPGCSVTGIAGDIMSWPEEMILKFLGKNEARGAQSILFAALDPRVKTGEYYQHGYPTVSSELTYDTQFVNQCYKKVLTLIHPYLKKDEDKAGFEATVLAKPAGESIEKNKHALRSEKIAEDQELQTTLKENQACSQELKAGAD